jgi:hypothetical protein
MIRRLLRRLFVPRSDVVSADWLRENDRRQSKVGIESVCIAWPINKLRDSAAWKNTRQLRRRA